MDRRSFRSSSCNGGGKNPVPAPSPAAAGSRTSAVPAAAGSRTSASPAAGSKEDAGAGERKALLPRHLPGGTARKGQKGPKRRVQWKDSHGKKLAEVLEFQPSDSSDSDDEYLDTCICTVM
ncbi:uncharacterized protein LOC100840053 [Brachypodium distachyon]|uniref:Uncharacterized protein n=1 Tax=Brachypodium distachyon TaxID=15368 RepID=I1H9Y7_BRADI|nr:uncharacterized protein LOC100840053 [Brachypodium distachyon]KQK23750.1 hypothetical protein BRADI_1g75850v3 [Brachypodium distachyon]|eukprot:XP_003558853.1 uncharacterized protein LOC100840053 [Brachypodium distachyon]